MLSATAACEVAGYQEFSWQSVPEPETRFFLYLSAKVLVESFIYEQFSCIQPDFLCFCRFGEVLVINSGSISIVLNENKSQIVLSPQTRYASYLVYKLPGDQSTFEAPMNVRDKDVGSHIWNDYWCIYLVTPQTQVIRPKNIQNTRNLTNRPKMKGFPQLRSEGWMEVLVYEFRTMRVIVSLELRKCSGYLN